jgi:MFS family permease
VSLVGRLGALQERDFRLFFIGQTTSLLGDGMVPVALAFAVLDLTHNSVADLGYVLASRSIPMIGFLLIGGVFADRLPRRVVMIGADLARLGSQGLIAALLISGHARLWELVALSAAQGAATAFFNPALTGLTPMIISPQRLQQANVLRGISMGLGGIAGPALAGVLVATVGSGYALAVDAASFGVSALFLAQLRLPAHVRLPAQSFLRDLLDGWKEVRSRAWLWMGVVAASVGNMAAAPFFILGAAITKTSLGGPGAWALIVAAFAVGALLGGLAALRARPRRPFAFAFTCYLAFPLPMLLLALHSPPIGIAAAACLAGAGTTVGNAIWETTLQQQVDPQALSRVTAYDWFGSLAFQPLGNALTGPVVIALGTRSTLLGAFAIGLGVNLVALSMPSIRGVRAQARPAAAVAD